MDEKQMALGVDFRWDFNPSGWFASEKFDGCRAYWDGSRFWTRGGKIINAPAWLTQGLPVDHHLDGELWSGCGQFDRASVAVRFGRFTGNEQFIVFDCPTSPGCWSERTQAARACTTAAPAASVVAGWRVESPAALKTRLSEIQRNGGEGIVLRHPFAGYVIGRSAHFQKVKV